MIIYRFRVTCEESEGFLREIEIQPNQTFLDFHYILVDSSELLQCEKASFFITDKKYKKDREISLKAAKRQVRKYDEDIDQVVTEAVPIPLMKSEKVKDHIDDPHQKMIYEFTGKDYYSFFIELFKIFQSDGITSFPRCVKRIGELPKKAEPPVMIPEKPATPVEPAAPRIPIPSIVEAIKLDHIVENDEELAAIENELGDLLTEAVELPETGEEMASGQEFDFEGEGEEGEDPNLEHLDDFEDIESLDRRMSGYDREQDDY